MRIILVHDCVFKKEIKKSIKRNNPVQQNDLPDRIIFVFV